MSPLIFLLSETLLFAFPCCSLSIPLRFHIIDGPQVCAGICETLSHLPQREYAFLQKALKFFLLFVYHGKDYVLVASLISVRGEISL